MATELMMTKMSDHMESGLILRWLAAEGQRVEQGQPLLEVETDKAVAELEAPASGLLRGIRDGTGEGARVLVGEVIAYIAEDGEEVPSLPALLTEQAAAPDAPTRSSPGVPRTGDPIRATPVARRVARELSVDLANVTGSGPGGQVLESDVRRLAESMPQRPAKDVGSDGATWLDLTPAQSLTARRMIESSRTAPQFSLVVQVDGTGLLALHQQAKDGRASELERITITDVLVWVLATTLRKHPRANASFVDGRIRIYGEVNVGVAVAAGDDLVVPVIRRADEKSLSQISRELHALREKARAMRLSPEDLSGGTVTLTNLGMYGVDGFTAILNPPQSAILAIGRISSRPVVGPDGTVAVRPLLTMTLTVDHRCINGLQAALVLQMLSEVITDLPRDHPGLSE